DCFGLFPDVLITQKREWTGFTWTMAGRAIPEDDRSDVFRERGIFLDRTSVGTARNDEDQQQEQSEKPFHSRPYCKAIRKHKRHKRHITVPLVPLWFRPVRLEVDTSVQSDSAASTCGRDAAESGTVDVRARVAPLRLVENVDR